MMLMITFVLQAYVHDSSHHVYCLITFFYESISYKMINLSSFLLLAFLAIYAKSEETFSPLNEIKSSCALWPTVISEKKVNLNFCLCARDFTFDCNVSKVMF